jgi:hypothetical protein
MSVRDFSRLSRVLFIGLFAGFYCLCGHAVDKPRLVIVKAVYGVLSDKDTIVDVTQSVAAMVKDDALNVAAVNENFEDRASGVIKQLRVDFTIDGVPGSKSVYENGRLKLSLADKPDPNKKPSKLVIRKATFGVPDGDSVDVTSILTGLIKGDALKFKVNTEDLGDPAEGAAKVLKLDYTLDGKDGSKTVKEGEMVEISEQPPK